MISKTYEVLNDIFLRKYPWKVHFFHETLEKDEIIFLIKFILEKQPLDKGYYIKKYEDEFRNFLDPEGYAFSFGSGRMALYAILEALNIGEGDEVILPAFTCEVVALCLLYRKIRPVYVDIEPYTYNIDPKKLEALITSRTRAIIVQHTFGVPCDLDYVLQIAQKYKIHVIEDCAIALGSSYKGKLVGTIGDASFFSTDRTKLISTQWGGMAYTKDKTIAQGIKKVYEQSPFLPKRLIFNIGIQMLLSYFLFSPYLYYIGRYIMAFGYKIRILFDHLDNKKEFNLPPFYPCRLSNLQCAIGFLQLNKLSKFLNKREEMIKKYVSILKKKNIKLNFDMYQNTRLRFSLLLKNREKFINKWNKYFEIGTWFDSPAMGYGNLEKIGYIKGSCLVAEFVHRHIVNFPTYQKSSKIINFLCKALESVNTEDIILPEDIKI